MENILVLPLKDRFLCMVLPSRQPSMHPARATVAPQSCLAALPRRDPPPVVCSKFHAMKKRDMNSESNA
jgi:hypothetical protein